MRYLMTTKESSREADEALFADMGAFIEEMTAAGILIATGGLEPGGVKVTSVGDEITVTDGPFVEAKEEILGFALVEVSSHEEALEVSRRFRRIVGDGDSILHRVMGP
jgi:hypothetical protein